jgi:hypothetical protein
MSQINSQSTLGSSELRMILQSFLTDITALTAIANELRTDHATFKTVVDELKTDHNALLAKLDADSGVTDTNYAATNATAASSPATLSAPAVTLVTS